MIGFATADVLEGGSGEDYLVGGDASDLYVFARGDGRDVIDDNGNGDVDRLEIRGYTTAETTVRRIEPDGVDILFTFAGTEDRIMIVNGLSNSAADTIEEIAF